MDYEEYFRTCWDSISTEVVSDEYYERNEDLMNAITEDLYYVYSKSNAIPPEIARRIITDFFSNLTKIGYR